MTNQEVEKVIQSQALVDRFTLALDEHWGYIWGAAGIQWTAARQKQKVDYMVSKYGTSWQKNSEAKQDNYYSAAVYGDKWIGHTVADCSGLFAWAFAKLGGSIAHGSNSIWDRYCSSKGKLSGGKRLDGVELKPGTAVFTGDDNKKPHIGLYVGAGKVIEAKGTQAGVCTSNVSDSKWKYWGELRGVEYSGDVPGETPGKPTLRRGDKGAYVKTLQTMLRDLFYNLGPCGIDGDFGKATQAAVREFQRDRGLTMDGVVGPATWEALEKKAPVVRYQVTISGLTPDQVHALCEKYECEVKEMTV